MDEAKVNCRTQILTISVWLIVCIMYLCLGMVVFVALEEKTTDQTIQHKKKMQENLKTDIQVKFNLSDQEFEYLVERTVEAYSSMPTQWSYLNSFAFVLQTITTIGYGYITPITDGGRIFCIFYALFGIPLAALLLQSTGKAIFQILVAAIIGLEKKVNQGIVNVQNAEEKSFIGSFLLLTVVIILYSVIFVYGYQLGTFVEGVYSWFITLTTIGYGDIVPGQSSKSLTLIWMRVIFMFLGLSITSSVLNSLGTCIEKRRKKTTFCKCYKWRMGSAARLSKNAKEVEIDGKAIEGSYIKRSDENREQEVDYELDDLK